MAAIPLEAYEGQISRPLAPVHEFPEPSLLDRLEMFIKTPNDYRANLPIGLASTHEDTRKKIFRRSTAAELRARNHHPILGSDRIPYEILGRTLDNNVVYAGRGGICTAAPQRLQWFMDAYISQANPDLYQRLCIGLARSQFSAQERDYVGRESMRAEIEKNLKK